MVAFIDEHRDATESSRSAPCCRSLRRPTIEQKRGPRTRRVAGAGAARCGPVCRRSSVSGTSTGGATARRRSGGSCTARGIPVARCTVRRLMRGTGADGRAVRGRGADHDPGALADRPPDLVHRDFTATRPESTLGVGPDLRGDLAGLRVCRLRHRCLLPTDRGLACLARRCGAIWPSTRWSRRCMIGTPTPG